MLGSNRKQEKRTPEQLRNDFHLNGIGFFASLKDGGVPNEIHQLNSNLQNLTQEIKSSNESSTTLSRALNRLTLAAVVIAALAFLLEGYKVLWPGLDSPEQTEIHGQSSLSQSQ